MKIINKTPGKKKVGKMIKSVYIQGNPMPMNAIIPTDDPDEIKEKLKSWAKAQKIDYKKIIKVVF